MVSKFIPSSVSTVSTNPYQLHIYLHICSYVSIYPYLHPQLQLIEKPQAQGFLKRLPWRSSHRGRLHKDLHTGSHQPVSEESGLIDKFKSLLFQFFPHGDPSKFASLVFRVFDENNVGKLFLQPLLHCYIGTKLLLVSFLEGNFARCVIFFLTNWNLLCRNHLLGASGRESM